MEGEDNATQKVWSQGQAAEATQGQVGFTLYQGSNLDLLPTLLPNSVDAIITDPPYGLSQHKPQAITACLTAWLAGEHYAHKGKGFMQNTWDSFVPGPELWRECYRVLKPGGHLLCFAGTRTGDLMGIALRLAGFELRTQIGWVFSSGFPKSLNVEKALEVKIIEALEDAGYNFTGWADE